MFLGVSVSLGLLSWKDAAFYQDIFLHLLRWSCLWVNLCDMLHLLIFICWIFSTSVESGQFDYSKWSWYVSVVVRFCWEYLHIYLLGILLYGFCFCVSSFSIGVILASSTILILLFLFLSLRIVWESLASLLWMFVYIY